MKERKKDMFSKKNQKYQEILNLKRKRRFEDAILALDEFISEYPNDIYARYEQAALYMKTKEETKALEMYEELKEIESNAQAYIYHRYIEYYIKKRDTKKALELIKEAVEKNLLTDYYYKTFLADICFINYELKEAFDLLYSIETNDQEEKDKIYLKIISNKDNIYLKENYKYIESRLNKLLKDKNHKWRVYLLLGKINYICCNYNKAYNYFNELASRNMNMQYEYLIYAYDICLILGKEEEAEKYNEKIKQKILHGTKYKKNSFYYKYEAINGNYEKAIELYLEDDNKYKNTLQFSEWCIITKKFDLLIDELNKVIENCQIKEFKLLCIAKLIDILIYKKEYEKVYKLILENEKDFIEIKKDIYIERILVLLNKKLNIGYKPKHLNLYITKQLENYSKEDAINHSKLHQEENDKKPIHSRINSFISVEELYETVDLEKAALVNVGVTDTYSLYYENVGEIYGVSVNYIIIHVEHDTKNILNLYPARRYNNTLEEKIESEVIEKPKVKRLSQIEKFNKKYNIWGK